MKQTVCNASIELFQVKNKPVIISQTGATVSSNGGFLAIHRMDRELGLIEKISAVFVDGKRRREEAVQDVTRIEHRFSDLLQQRVYQIALGYEDGLDANRLRHDKSLQLAVGKDQALASQPMMSRLENWVSFKDIYRGMRELVGVYAREFHDPQHAIVLHIDSTDDPVHGQLGLFNGYYQEHCFHPLVIMEERSGFPFGILLRRGQVSSARYARSMLQRLIRWLREEIPGVAIVVKGDCAFGIGDILESLDAKSVDYIAGLSGNAVLYREVKALQEDVQTAYESTHKPLQRFMSFRYRAGTWQQERSVIAKVEHTGLGLNTRFVVSSMCTDDPASCYESFQVRSGGIEALIEQLKNGLRFDKTACHSRVPNQMRYFENMLAFILHLKLQQKLKPVMEYTPKVQTIIQKVLKVAALITTSVRRFFIELSTADPNTALLWHVLQT